MPKQVITFSLDKTMVDAMDVLASGLSRTEWLRVGIRAGIGRRLAVNEAAITQFHQLSVEAGRHAEGNTAEETADAKREMAEFRGLIAQYEAENLILYKCRLGAADGEGE